MSGSSAAEREVEKLTITVRSVRGSDDDLASASIYGYGDDGAAYLATPLGPLPEVGSRITISRDASGRWAG